MRVEELAPDEQFDVVLFLNVLHHVTDPVDAIRRLVAVSFARRWSSSSACPTIRSSSCTSSTVTGSAVPELAEGAHPIGFDAASHVEAPAHGGR